MGVKYEVSIYLNSKIIAKVKVDNGQTYRQTDRQDKLICPQSFDEGHKY